MNYGVATSQGEAELEQFLRRADVAIDRRVRGGGAQGLRFPGGARVARPVVTDLRALVRQRATQAMQPPVDLEIDCTFETVLENFEVGDYRLRPHHYEPLLGFIRQVLLAAAQPGVEILVSAIGRADETGPELMNFGLSMSRAMEASAALQGWFEFLGIPVTVGAIPFGEHIAPLPPPHTVAGRRRNRSVTLSLCIGRRPAPPPILTARGGLGRQTLRRQAPRPRPS